MNKSNIRFHCNVENCLYREGSDRYFKSKKLLNQHLVKVHAEKKYPCTRCSKGFATETLRRLHESTCGQVWECFTCKASYPCRETLLTHERRTQHAITSPLASSIRKRKPKSQSFPVIILFNGTREPEPTSSAISKSSVQCRQILPKMPPSQETPLSSSAIAALALSELAQQSKIPVTSKSVAIQTLPVTITPSFDNNSSDAVSHLNGSSAEACASATSSPRVNGPNVLRNAAKRRPEKHVQCQKTSFDDNESQTHKASNILMQAMEMASIPVQTESRAAQCSPNFNPSPTPYTERQGKQESIQTQTTESVLVKLKRPRRSSITRLRKRLTSTGKESKGSQDSKPDQQDVPQDIEECVKGVLSRVNCFLFDERQSGEELKRIEDLITHCSSSTQTNSYLQCLKDFCDSQTETADFCKSTEAKSLQRENLPGPTVKPLTTSYNQGPTSNSLNQPQSSDAYLSVFSQSEALTLDGACGSVHAGVNTNMQICLNTQTQTDLAGVALLTANTEQSIQTELDTLRLFSTIETQTVGEEDFDYAHVSAHMETQTTEDFFSSLELADIETQTAWEDISSLVSSEGSEESCIQKMCSSPAKQDSADLMDMETQTPFEFCGPELIDSYAQTLDLEFTSGLFNT